MGAFKLDGDVFLHIKQDIIKVGNKLEFKAINGDMNNFNIDDVRAKYKVI